jgi:hypothetical protein
LTNVDASSTFVARPNIMKALPYTRPAINIMISSETMDTSGLINGVVIILVIGVIDSMIPYVCPDIPYSSANKGKKIGTVMNPSPIHKILKQNTLNTY